MVGECHTREGNVRMQETNLFMSGRTTPKDFPSHEELSRPNAKRTTNEKILLQFHRLAVLRLLC